MSSLTLQIQLQRFSVTLADLAEKMEQFDLAETLYRRMEKLPGTGVQGKLVLAEFLGRRERTKDALDMCEPLWKDDSGNRTSRRDVRWHSLRFGRQASHP